MKFATLPLLAASLFAATPAMAEVDDAQTTTEATNAAAAGDDAATAALLTGLFGSMFGEEIPLSPEAQERLPAATQVVNLIFPEGSYAQLMEQTMGSMSEGLMQGLEAPARTSSVAKLTGLAEFELMDVDEETFTQLIASLDPVFDQRSKLVMDITTAETTAMMVALEPSYREGLSNAYAERFTADQLAELLGFFATPTGAFYAGQSMQIYADPHVLAKMNEMFPIMMERMPAMATKMEEALAALPEERYFDELPSADKKRLAKLLGRSVKELDTLAAESRSAAEAMESLDDWSTLFSEEAEDAAYDVALPAEVVD